MIGALPTSIEHYFDVRGLTSKQRLALEFCTNTGAYTGENRRRPMCLYGGAGFGGKSYLLRSAPWFFNWLLLTKHGIRNPWGMLATIDYPNLAERHLKPLDQGELSAFGELRENKRLGLHFRFHGEGMGGFLLRNVVADHNARDNNRTRRGGEVSYLLIDELTELTEGQFGKLMYNARGVGPQPWVPFLGATNPDGIGYDWVRRTFHPEFRDINDASFKRYQIPPRDWLFIQALKGDNPYYHLHREIVDAAIGAEVDPNIARARDEGIWDFYASSRFGASWRYKVHTFDWQEFYAVHGIPTRLSVREMLHRHREWGLEPWGALDFGTSPDSTSAYGIELVDSKGRYWSIGELAMSGLDLETQAAKIRAFETHYLGSPDAIIKAHRICDPALLGKQQYDQRGIAMIDRFKNAGVPMTPGINDRVQGAATMATCLRFKADGDGNVLVPPRWRLHRNCKNTIKEIPTLPRDKGNPEDVDPRDGTNHWYDRARYFLHTKKANRARGPEPATRVRNLLKRLEMKTSHA